MLPWYSKETSSQFVKLLYINGCSGNTHSIIRNEAAILNTITWNATTRRQFNLRINRTLRLSDWSLPWPPRSNKKDIWDINWLLWFTNFGHCTGRTITMKNIWGLYVHSSINSTLETPFPSFRFFLIPYLTLKNR